MHRRLRHGLIVDCSSLPDPPSPPHSSALNSRHPLYSQDERLEIGCLNKLHLHRAQSGGTKAFPPPHRNLTKIVDYYRVSNGYCPNFDREYFP